MRTPTLLRARRKLPDTMPPKIRVGGMQRQSKPTQVKKVAPPTVPDIPANRKSSGSCSSGYSSSSCSSSNLENTSLNPLMTNDNYPSSPCLNRPNLKDSIHHGATTTDNGNVGELPSLPSTHPYSSFHYPPQPYSHYVIGSRCITSQPGSPLPQDSSMLIQGGYTREETLYDSYPPTFQAQVSLEDQGIDLQSPGRDSPGSSGSSGSGSGCRNSTTSLDSGRASSAYDSKIGHTYIQTQHRLSSHSYESTGSLRHSYHSSSSSLGSAEEPHIKHIPVADLLASGFPDHDVLNRWLMDLHFEEYYPLFAQAGYDMPTISRMTPEDLTAIGITKPGHRKKLKAEIARLNISDGLPLYIPNTLIEWLHLLRLEEYEATLYHQGYHSVQQVTDIAWEDLEEIGIKKLGHQKKIMLAIKRVKDIMSGVRRFSIDPQDSTKMNSGKDTLAYNYQLQEVAITTSKPIGTVLPHDGCNQLELRTFQQQPQQYVPHSVDSFHYDGLNTGSPVHHIIPADKPANSPTHSYRLPYGHVPGINSPSHMLYRPDMVAIHVSHHPSGARSLENLEINRDGKSPPTYTSSDIHNFDNMQLLRRGSYDDGDITPTNEFMLACDIEGGGTLPRPKVSVKPRPVAKIMAKTRCSSTESALEPLFGSDQNYESKLLREKEKTCDIISYGMSRNDKIGSLYGTLGRGKKTPPPPPKRTNSIKNDRNVEKNIDPKSEQAFADCVKNLTSKFTISSGDNAVPSLSAKEAADNSMKAEMFVPQPESLAHQTDGLKRVHMGSPQEFSERLTESLLLQNDSDELLLHPKRNDSNSSFDSSSSTDSNSLPFANENIGTIKQRAIKQHPSLTVVEMNRSPIASPALSGRVLQSVGVNSIPSEYQYDISSSGMDDYDDVAGDEDDIDSQLERLAIGPQDTGDVLSDIGNMLADLTDELDAMLESELHGQ